ncbi:hypothetical protein D3C78_1600870 [compost metagenome]
MINELPPRVVNVAPDKDEAQADGDQADQLGDGGWLVRQVQTQYAHDVHQNPGATEQK